MHMEIRRLNPELCDDWLSFFDGIAFGDHGEWAFCYCLEGHMTRQANEELKEPGVRRKYGISVSWYDKSVFESWVYKEKRFAICQCNGM